MHRHAARIVGMGPHRDLDADLSAWVHADLFSLVPSSTDVLPVTEDKFLQLMRERIPYF